jgi:hypothetical protein
MTKYLSLHNPFCPILCYTTVLCMKYLTLSQVTNLYTKITKWIHFLHHELSREHRLPVRLRIHVHFKRPISAYSELFNCGNISHHLRRISHTMQPSGIKILQTLSHDIYSLVGEELKKRLPEHVSEIEQERVKYLTLTFTDNSKSDF